MRNAKCITQITKAIQLRISAALFIDYGHDGIGDVAGRPTLRGIHDHKVNPF